MNITVGEKKNYVAIAGPTGSGKSALAMAIARQLDGEIVSCDSVQLYSGFDIGSAKPTITDQAEIRHHMIDVLQWHEEYDAKSYAAGATKAIADITARGKLPIVVGGTGLYLRALWREDWHELPKDETVRKSLEKLTNEQLRQGLIAVDPDRARQIHLNDRFRLLRAVELVTILKGPVTQHWAAKQSDKQLAFTIRLKPQRQQLLKQISQRTQFMIDAGIIDEVKGLLANSVSIDCKPMSSIGYRQVAMLLQRQLLQVDLSREIVIATAQYAKRQSTWFNKVEVDCVIEDVQQALGKGFAKLLLDMQKFF